MKVRSENIRKARFFFKSCERAEHKSGQEKLTSCLSYLTGIDGIISFDMDILLLD